MLRLRSLLTATAACVGLLGMSVGPASAQERAAWRFSVGVYPLTPQERSHTQLDVGRGAALAFETTWMFAPYWGVELMATAPVEHDLYAMGAGKVGAVKHAPFALTLQRRFFDPNGRVQAFAGVGVAYSSFFDERTSGSLEGAEVDAGSSEGLTAQAGVEIDVDDAWFVALSARWFDFDVPAAIDGATVGELELDPYAVGLAIGRRVR